MRNKILIYRDYGSANVDCLYEQLTSHFSNLGIVVDWTDATEIKNGALTDEVKLFVLGGGAGTPYMKKLNPIGNEKIRNYVANGGCYLGICAGAYYACENIEFETDIPELSIQNQCGLNLVKGNAIGTLYKEYGLLPYSLTAFSACVLKVCFNDGGVYPSFYQGGPYFETTDAKVLAFYDLPEPKPALLYKQYGQGKVILSGFHFEEDEQSLSTGLHKQRCDYEQAKNNFEKIKQSEQERFELFNRIIELF